MSPTKMSPTIHKKIGILYKRSDHLKQWRKRYFEAENHFLKISHDESGKELKIIDIRDYAVRWNEKIKDKYVFSLVLLPGKKSNKIKSLILAAKEEKLAKEWYTFFKDRIVIFFMIMGNV